ncbi:hypothetical protein [Spirosoma validum]|uniref:Coproporphyrinogen III oxidase n=1 Tax=Spirosoma validum TaxID=2771355 RepID=A0A927B6T0_9BACT|nr:hypothetical protein [Spirosoma validum]MBD2756272.1 hypothetical protein [Spirosoma validum]
MKKVFALLFVGSMLTFASCQSKPKTEETSTDSTAVITTDTTVMATDSSATMMTETDTTMVPDSAKK